MTAMKRFDVIGKPRRRVDGRAKVTGLTRFADDSLAHDIFSMTIDSLGRVVVSGPGYVRILVDSDGSLGSVLRRPATAVSVWLITSTALALPWR